MSKPNPIPFGARFWRLWSPAWKWRKKGKGYLYPALLLFWVLVLASPYMLFNRMASWPDHTPLDKETITKRDTLAFSPKDERTVWDPKSIFKDNIEELFQLGAATMHPKNKIDNYKKVPVKTKKLDDIEIGNKIGLIKIDVEGHERNVLQGGIETVKNNKPVLLVEIEERHTKIPITETINFIKSIGYKGFISKENNLLEIDKVSNLKKENNFFFLPLDHKLIQSSGQ